MMTQYVDFIAVQNHFTAHLRVEQQVSAKECFYIQPFAHYLIFAPLPLQLIHCAKVADNCSVCEVSTDFSILVLSILIKD